MDVVCPSLPLKILTPNVTDAELRPADRHTPRMAADGCHLATCSLYVLLVIIEISSSPCAIMSSRELSCIRQDHRSCQALSTGNILRTLARVVFDNSTAWSVALRSWKNKNAKELLRALTRTGTDRYSVIDLRQRWDEHCLRPHR